MNRRTRTLAVLIAGIAALVAGEALAQGMNPAFTTYRNNLLRRPTVSPYLNLLQQQEDGLPSYHTLVRPQLQQGRFNQFQSVQVRQLQQQLARSAAAQNDSPPIRETGHLTTFMNLSHFFPTAARRR